MANLIAPRPQKILKGVRKRRQPPGRAPSAYKGVLEGGLTAAGATGPARTRRGSAAWTR